MVYRHMSPAFLPDAIAGRLPHFDAFDWQAGHVDYADVAKIAEHYNARADRYVQVLIHPCPEWVGGDPIVDFVAATMPVLTAPAPPPDPTGPGGPTEGKKAIWPRSWFGCRDQAPRYLIDWRLADVGKLMGFAQTIKSELDRVVGAHADPSLAKVGVRLDLYWTNPEWWMFDSTGAAFEDFPASEWTYWERRMMRFRTMLQSVIGESRPILVNGQWSAKQPIQLENAHWRGRWDDAVDLWEDHQGALISTDPNYVEWVDRLVDLHDRNPNKWVSFQPLGDASIVNAAYEKLVA